MAMGKYTFSITYQFDNQVPPKKVTTIDTGSKGPLRGFCFSHETNQFFATCYSDGHIYGYEMIGDLSNDCTSNRIFLAKGSLNPRDVVFVESLNKLIVGYESGQINVYDLGIQNCPVCKLNRLQKNT